MAKQVEKLKEGENIARNAILVNLGLAILKSLIGFISGSLSLITDGVHTAADSITNFASWFSLKISQREPTEKFPYGYYRIESIITVFICIFLFFAGYELLKESYSKLFTLTRLEKPYWALGVSIISSVVSFIFSRKEKEVGEKVNSQSLLTISEDTKVNAFISLVVLAAIISTFFQIRYVEAAVGLLISLMIFKVAFENGKGAIYALMDVSPSKELERKIENIIKSIKGVENFEGLKLRSTGPFVIGEVKIKTKKFLDVRRAHEIADNIEERVKREVEDVISLTVHVEPYKPKERKIAIPVETKAGLRSKLSKHFGRAKYFMILDLEKDKVESHYFLDNEYLQKKVRAGLFAVNKIILKEGVDAVITKSIGSISLHTLRDNYIAVYLSEKKTVQYSIRDFVKEDLELLQEPTRKLGKEKVGKK